MPSNSLGWFNTRKIMPSALYKRLWGDRDRWGLEVDERDSCWQQWQDAYSDFYLENQREGIGVLINDAGYEIMKSVNLSDKRILEIGPGDIRHTKYWSGRPAEYVLVDISENMMDLGRRRLEELSVAHKTIIVNRNEKINIEDESIDLIVSFYSLEHLNPLHDFLLEYHRFLKPGGKLVGAIPAEGGLAWGSGRMLTSRRWFRANTQIDTDKIICWEHPNFADHVINELDQVFSRKKVATWPFNVVPLLDANLIVKFLYEKP